MGNARRFMWGAALASFLVAAPFAAISRAQTEVTTRTAPADVDRRPDMGWLGLLGLAGLAGLMKKPGHRVESGTVLGAGAR